MRTHFAASEERECVCDENERNIITLIRYQNQNSECLLNNRITTDIKQSTVIWEKDHYLTGETEKHTVLCVSYTYNS